MSLDPLTVSIATSVIGGGLQMMSQQSAMKKQRALGDQMTAYRSERAAQSRAAIEPFLNSLNPEQRAAERTAVADELRTGLTDSVGAVQKFQAPQAIAGKVSNDFADRTATNQASTADRIKSAIEQLTGIGAQGELGLREARRFAQAGSNVAANAQAAGNVSGRYEDAMNNVRPDPFLNYASQVTQGAGQGYAARLRGLGAGLLPELVPGQYSLGNRAYG